MDFTAGLMPLDTALTQMLDRITPLSATETVPLLQAFARVTAHDIISPLDVPGFDNAAMDGYAVRLSDLRDGAALPVAGKAFAGQPFHDAWPTGTCIRIMTGAPVPAGCDAVVMQEETEQTDAGVRFTAPVKAGQHIRRRGEDIAHGAVVFPAGTPLTVAELPVLASLGIADVEVVRKIRVAVFSTGDELQLPGQPLGDGQIYDTNRLAVHLMLEQLGCEVINLGIIPDDPAQLREAFIAADQQADVVISSGGVSVGTAPGTHVAICIDPSKLTNPWHGNVPLASTSPSETALGSTYTSTWCTTSALSGTICTPVIHTSLSTFGSIATQMKLSCLPATVNGAGFCSSTVGLASSRLGGVGSGAAFAGSPSGVPWATQSTNSCFSSGVNRRSSRQLCAG